MLSWVFALLLIPAPSQADGTGLAADLTAELGQQSGLLPQEEKDALARHERRARIKDIVLDCYGGLRDAPCRAAVNRWLALYGTDGRRPPGKLEATISSLKDAQSGRETVADPSALYQALRTAFRDTQ